MGCGGSWLTRWPGREKKGLLLVVEGGEPGEDQKRNDSGGWLHETTGPDRGGLGLRIGELRWGGSRNRYREIVEEAITVEDGKNGGIACWRRLRLRAMRRWRGR